MNSKLIQTCSSIFLGTVGLTATFLPDEIASNFGMNANEYANIIIQILGALYVGFAMTNWMGKTLLIGGIYGKALYMGNFAHFLIGALALLKWNIRNGASSKILMVLLAGYLIFAVVYGLFLFKTPKTVTLNEDAYTKV